MTLAEKIKKSFISQIEKFLKECQIYYNHNTNSIWFINPETKYWYFEYSLDGELWWRYDGFNMLKTLYRMDDKVFDGIISEWVEETLNCKVLTTGVYHNVGTVLMEETLNCKVVTTKNLSHKMMKMVEETLNCKVLTIEPYEPYNEVNTENIINESEMI